MSLSLYFAIGTLLILPTINAGFIRMVNAQFDVMESEIGVKVPQGVKLTMLFVVTIALISLWPFLLLIFLGAKFL
jgi:hypothetical protein